MLTDIMIQMAASLPATNTKRSHQLRPRTEAESWTKTIVVKKKMAGSGSGSVSASKIVAKLNLQPHPEGGFFAETLRDTSVLLTKSQLPPQYKVDRAVSTSIYFLMPSGSVSHLHRIPCAETWHFYLGEPLTVMELNDKDGQVKLTCLGNNLLDDNQYLQYTVPPNVWFGAFPSKDFEISPDGPILKTAPRDAESHFSLVGCTCAPAFQFEDFELANRTELIKQFPKFEPLISLLTFPDPQKS